VAEQEAIWHVVVENKEFGPYAKTKILEYLRDGRLAGSDLIWRPGFPDWKTVSEVSDFWSPPKRPVTTAIQLSPPLFVQSREEAKAAAPVPIRKRWSIWRAASCGLLISFSSLLFSIANGKGFGLANVVHHPTASTLAYLISYLAAIPVFFVSATVLRNASYGPLENSAKSPIRNALVFAVLLALVAGALIAYGELYFSSDEKISGVARDAFVRSAQPACVLGQRSLSQNASDAQIESYCSCTIEKLADDTTYREMGGELDAKGRATLQQKAVAVGSACQIRP
jgi:hypothetical protein